MTKLAVIGAGKMAEAIIQGLISKKVFAATEITATDIATERLTYMNTQYGIRTSGNNLSPLREAAIVLLAVKPQTIAGVLEEIQAVGNTQQIIISIVAGIPCKRIDPSGSKKIARVMPNTPSVVGQAASAVSFQGPFTEEDRNTVLTIFNSIGLTLEVPEAQINAVTGLSGSGPAFVFYMMQAYIDAGIAHGLTPEVAKALTYQTFIGSALLAQSTGTPLSELINNVTSPNGTTWAGRQILEAGSLHTTILQTVQRAKERADELSKE